jgi:hypothetical protein
MKRFALLPLFALALGCGASAEPTPPSSITSIACGSAELVAYSHNACDAMDAKGVPDPKMGNCKCVLGYAWSGTECIGVSNCACEGTDCNKLTAEKAECEALNSACKPPQPSVSTKRLACSDARLYSLAHDSCASMDAKGVPDPKIGTCKCVLGYAWNGTECIGVGNCACEGEDCDKLTQDKGACEAAHAQCQ